MSPWLLAAIAFGMLGGGAVVAAARGSSGTRLVAVEMIGILAVLFFVCLGEALERPSFVDMALVYALFALAAGLSFVRFVVRRP